MRHLRQFSRKYSKNVICDKSFILQETPWRISMGSLFMQNVLILEHVNALNFVNNERRDECRKINTAQCPYQ